MAGRLTACHQRRDFTAQRFDRFADARAPVQPFGVVD
jgi:hypothetical protein